MSLTSLESIISPDSKGPEVKSSFRWGRGTTAAIPWVLLLGFALLAWLLFGDRLQRSTPVNVESVVTVRQSSDSISSNPSRNVKGQDPWESQMLFQASGWIEPDPLPIKATALVNGVIKSVAVLEGEAVTQGQLLAELISEDFELDLETAQSDLSALQAGGKAHESAIDAAQARIVTLDKLVEAGRMKCLELEDRRERLETVGAGAISEEALTLARLRLDTHASEVEALAISRVELESELSRLEAMRLEVSSRVRRAETEVARRELALARTEIRAPVDGIILRLLAVPGQKRMLLMDDADSATVAILYQPDSLQARIDVPLEEAAQLTVGQSVRMRSNFLANRIFRGTVTRIAGEADLQRNTLQAKVRVENPDHRLRPDMLCRAEFLASTSLSSDLGGRVSDEGSSGGDRIALYVPETALFERSGDKAIVWAVSSLGDRVERRSLTLGSESRDGYVNVHSGIRPGDQVVISPSADLVDGERINLQPVSEKP